MKNFCAVVVSVLAFSQNIHGSQVKALVAAAGANFNKQLLGCVKTTVGMRTAGTLVEL